MNNIFKNNTLTELKALCSSASGVSIVSHTNPDGDAIGSGIALLRHLRAQGIEARFFVPNHFPDFLRFVDPESRDAEVFSVDPAFCKAYIAASDLIICVDFNQLNRLEGMTHALECNIHARRVLIDHHIDPANQQFDLRFSDTTYSSTAHMIFDLITEWNGTHTLSREIAEPLYLGMMTDTGCFTFGNLTPELYRAVADLVAAGVDVVEVNRLVFDNQSEDRTRMVGYLLSQKMVVNPSKGAAYITLTMDEKRRFNHRIGDTEGIVNLPLSIHGITFSAILIQTEDCIKLSLRSQGDKVDVNLVARQYFSGGGHRNAAGGKFFGSMEQAVERIEQVIATL